MKTVGSFETPMGSMSVTVGKYPLSGALFVQLRDGRPGALGKQERVISANLKPHGYQVDRNEFHVRSWDANDDVLQAAMATGVFEDTGKSVQVGFVRYQIWRINPMSKTAS